MNGDTKDVQMSPKSSKRTLPSKLPILESHRQRSNSLVFMDYNRSPRRDSLTASEISVESIRSSNLTTKKKPRKKKRQSREEK
ncbi:ankyrin-2 [Caerostris extrusa]|uniref:Ankyrin-2 n=1 Tax=Caerostris extrusa TaxID=172846 RepID=A0AAV4M9U3_CAEEX|nr:ankyrin-2 [Caerostris extrusa]